jgi:histidinol-phosphate aminotransferase
MNKKKNIFRTQWNTKVRDSKKLWLDKNENNDIFLKKLYLNIVKKIKFSDISAYPDLTESYEKISIFLKIKKNKIFLSAGSDLAIKSIFETFVLPGDKVLTTNPTYAMYGLYCKIFNAKNILIEYEFSKQNPYLNIIKLVAAIKKYKPKLICIPNPDSPTGQIISKKNLEDILKISIKNKSLVLIDEAYYLFYKNSFLNYINKYDNLIITRSASKAMAIAGLRVGIVISNPKLISKIFMNKPMYEISSIGSLFIKEIIKLNNYKLIKKSVQRLLDGKSFFINYLKKKDIDFFQGYGNFIHVNFGSSRKKIINSLQKKIYFRANQNHRSLKNYSRISLTNKENFKSIIKVINKFY